jgi:integrase
MDTKRFGAHSLRSRFITEALRAGHSFKAVMLQADHISSVALEAYERHDDQSHVNPVLDLGI